MVDTGAPEVLWDYCLEWCAHVRSHLALNIRQLDGQTPAIKMTGDTSDISHLAEFGWYNWVWYMDVEGKPGQEATGQRSMGRKRLGRYLGPSHNVGGAMCGVVLTERGERLHRTSIFPLSVEDKNSKVVDETKDTCTDVLNIKLKHRKKAISGAKTRAQIKLLEEH